MTYPTHYRLRDYADSDGVIVKVEKWYVAAETPCGYWVVDEHDRNYLGRTDPWADSLLKKNRRWTPKLYPKTFNPDMKLAVLSFRNRKRVQLSKLNWQMQQALQVDAFLKTLDDATVTEEGFNCGVPADWLGLSWG